MKAARRAFLTTFFRILDRDGVSYCVLRNYDAIYEDTGSDIDLAVELEDLQRLIKSLEQAGQATDFHFIHQARYINYSFVYWHREEGFVRVDFETEVRWRIFPVLTAKSVIGLRRKKGEFYIPHPRHESVILFVAAIWRREISGRYREQLAHLYQQTGNREQLQRTFRATLGSCGERLAKWQERILKEDRAPGIWRAARRSLIRNSFRDGPTRRALWKYLTVDILRLRERIRQPAGISLLYASSGQVGLQLDQLHKRLEFLYPIKKSVVHAFSPAGTGNGAHRLSLRLRTERLRILFKGGLFLRFYNVADSQMQEVLRSHARYLFPSRAFLAAELPGRGIYLAHIKTGFMSEFSAKGNSDPTDGIVQFISGILERAKRRNKAKQLGNFVVMVGLDGSGKTTLARTVCCRVAGRNFFTKVRYFHWQPTIFRQPSFPLPDMGPVPRKLPLEKTLLRSLVSSLRLAKNLILANLGYWLRTRPLKRRGALVLVDRYYYNYFLDPVSVKYYGPQWLLQKAQALFPKPDLVVVLKASTQTLLARKQELSPEEAERQNKILEDLRFNAKDVLELDAGRPSEELAGRILDKLTGLESRGTADSIAQSAAQI